MKTIEMEIALMEYFNVRQNLIVPNVSWGLLPDFHECDLLILRNSMIATEIEIKVSKSDLLKDKKKKHDHSHDLITWFYFAVPAELKDYALANIPEKAGLITVKTGSRGELVKGEYKAIEGYNVKAVREPIKNKTARKWIIEEKIKLYRLAAMRILPLKKNNLKLTNFNC